MKVLHVYRTYFPDSQGGAEEVVRQICRNTKPLGIESRIFYPSTHPIPMIINAEEGQLVRVKKNFEIASCGFCLGGLGEFRRQANWADIIHYHFPWPFADVMHLATSVNRPSLVTYHSDIVRQRWLSRLYEPVMKRFLDSMDRIVATSPNYVSSSKLLSKLSDKLEVIPLGLDESILPEISDEFLSEVELQFGRNFFLFVGVLRYYKGLHILLQALKGQEFNAVIAGSGPEEKNLKQLTQTLNLSNVSFTGYVSDQTKVALMKLSRAFILPSHLRSEAFGVSLLEASSLGKPMITTELGTGTSFVNLHNETGFVAQPENVESLMNSMARLHKDPELARSFGDNAKLRFKNMFTGTKMASAYTDIYSDIV